MIDCLMNSNNAFLQKHLEDKKRLQSALQNELREALLEQNTKNPTALVHSSAVGYFSENDYR